MTARTGKGTPCNILRTVSSVYTVVVWCKANCCSELDKLLARYRRGHSWLARLSAADESEEKKKQERTENNFVVSGGVLGVPAPDGQAASRLRDCVTAS